MLNPEEESMTQSRLDEVLERVKALTPAEQWRLRDVLDVMLEAPRAPAMTEDEFEQEMAREGVMTVPPPITDLSPYARRQPVAIEGEPLSETILRERR